MIHGPYAIVWLTHIKTTNTTVFCLHCICLATQLPTLWKKEKGVLTIAQIAMLLDVPASTSVFILVTLIF